MDDHEDDESESDDDDDDYTVKGKKQVKRSPQVAKAHKPAATSRDKKQPMRQNKTGMISFIAHVHVRENGVWGI